MVGGVASRFLSFVCRRFLIHNEEVVFVAVSQLERFWSTMRHEKPDELLFYMGFTPDLDARMREQLRLSPEDDLAARLGMFAPVNAVPAPPQSADSPDFSPYFSDVTMPDGSFINRLGVLEIPGSMYHFTRYVSPLRQATTFADLEAFPFPSTEGHTTEHMGPLVEAAHKQGRAAQSWLGHMYEDAWQIRGYEQFLMDMLTQPDWCEFILDKLKERNLFNAKAAAKAGVDFIRTGDDVANQKAMMFSVDHWRRFMKPRWAEVYAAARAIKPDLQIWYHSDGNIATIIPDLIEIGVTILNPVQPECLDPAWVKREFGQHLVLDGTIGTQTTMPFGSADDVRSTVRQRIETLGGDGGLIVSPTHVLEPEVPVDNVFALIDTVQGSSS